MLWLKRAGLTLGVLILAAAALAGLSCLSYRNDTRIDTAKGVDEAGYVRIGGIDQWVQIRGDDRGNPVLLWLNGGPGFSTIPNTFAFCAWEKDAEAAYPMLIERARALGNQTAEQQGEMLDDDLPALGLKFGLPVVFIQRAEDRLTVTALARDYFDSIEAPSKKFVVLDGAGHNAIVGDRDAFLKALDEHVRPLALSN